MSAASTAYCSSLVGETAVHITGVAASGIAAVELWFEAEFGFWFSLSLEELWGSCK